MCWPREKALLEPGEAETLPFIGKGNAILLFALWGWPSSLRPKQQLILIVIDSPTVLTITSRYFLFIRYCIGNYIHFNSCNLQLHKALILLPQFSEKDRISFLKTEQKKGKLLQYRPPTVPAMTYCILDRIK